MNASKPGHGQLLPSPGRSLALQLTPLNIIATALVLLLTIIVKRRYFSTLSSVPGPFLASISRLWHIIRIIKGRVSQDTLELHEKYGPFVRIAPDEVSVSHPDAPKQLLLNTLHKGYWYDVAAVPDWRYQTPLSTTNPKEKTARSKAFASGYTLSNMLQTEEHIDKTIEKLLDWMDKFSADKKPMELDLFFSYTAFDIIGEVLFSRPFGFIEKGEDIDGTLHVGQPINAYAAVAGYVGKLHHFLANPITSDLGLLPTGFLFKTAMTAVQERSKNPDSRYDMVAHWLRTMKEHPERLSKNDLHANLITNVGAGSDATSCSLQSFVYHMIRHPECWARAREEIDAERAQGRCSGRVIAYEHAQTLTYFQACLKESLRLFSPQGLGLQRVAPPGGLTLGDRTFPAGTVLSIHPKYVFHYRYSSRYGVIWWKICTNRRNRRTMQLDKTIWGPDAHQFKPERWLAEDAASKDKYWLVVCDRLASFVKKLSRYLLIRFTNSVWPRICFLSRTYVLDLLCLPLDATSNLLTMPAEHLARIEMSKILSTIVRDYDIAQVNPAQEWKWRASFATLPSDWPVYIQKRAV